MLHVDHVKSHDIGVEHNQVLSSGGVATMIRLGYASVRLVCPTGSIITHDLLDNGAIAQK